MSLKAGKEFREITKKWNEKRRERLVRSSNTSEERDLMLLLSSVKGERNEWKKKRETKRN